MRSTGSKTHIRRTISVCIALAFLLSGVAAFAKTYAVRADGSCALVSAEGAVVVAPGQYAELLAVADGIFAARASAGSGLALINDAGEALSEELYEDICSEGGMLLFRQNGRYGVMNEQREIVYQPQYTRIVSNESGGFLALRTDPDDESADGVYLLDGKGGEETTGTTVAYGLNAFSGGLSPAASAGTRRTGYLNASGLWEISPQYAYATDFIGSLAVAAADSGVGVIDSTGNWAVSPKYESVALSRGNGVFTAMTGGGRVTIFDAETLSIVADVSGGAAYARTERLRDMALVTVGGISSLYSRGGEVLASWNEDEGAALWSGGEDRILLVADEEAWLLNGRAEKIAGPYAEVSKLESGVYAYADFDGYSGLMDENGNVFLETRYDSISKAAPGMYIARDAGGAYLIDSAGETLLEFPAEAEKQRKAG